jgi:hypothetical protein
MQKTKHILVSLNTHMKDNDAKNNIKLVFKIIS